MKLLFRPAVALGDDDALVGLHALARAFDDVDADDHGVAGANSGMVLLETGDFFPLEGLDQVHLFLQDLARGVVEVGGPQAALPNRGSKSRRL